MARFKRKEFREQAEWRIVVRPDHTRFSSDITEADRNCQCYIRTRSSRRYVELSTSEPEPCLVPGVALGPRTARLMLPINAIRIAPFNNADEMATLARQLLDTHLEAASVLPSKFSSTTDQPTTEGIQDGRCR